MLSSYQTIGAGQNLQYRKPEDVDVVQVNDNVRELLEKDFDCIYLEKPTNIVVNVFGNNIISEETLVRFIFEMEFLMENNEVSRAAGIHDIKEIFKKSDSSVKANLLSNRYETCSIQNASLRVLIQAVGRICRTGLKNKNIYIYISIFFQIVLFYFLSNFEIYNFSIYFLISNCTYFYFYHQFLIN